MEVEKDAKIALIAISILCNASQGDPFFIALIGRYKPEEVFNQVFNSHLN